MKLFQTLGLWLLAATTALAGAGTPVPPTTAFTRNLLLSTNATDARDKLGVSSGGGSATGLTNHQATAVTFDSTVEAEGGFVGNLSGTATTADTATFASSGISNVAGAVTIESDGSLNLSGTDTNLTLVATGGGDVVVSNAATGSTFRIRPNGDVEASSNLTVHWRIEAVGGIAGSTISSTEPGGLYFGPTAAAYFQNTTRTAPIPKLTATEPLLNSSGSVKAAQFDGSVALASGHPTPKVFWDSVMPVPVKGYVTFADDHNGGAGGFDIMGSVITNVVNLYKANGLWTNGWNTIWFDSGWQQATRDGSGNLQVTTNINDLPGLVHWIHTNGFKVGFYLAFSDNSFCNPNAAGTPAEYIYKDMLAIANLGGDFVKVDGCFAGGTSTYMHYLWTSFGEAVNDINNATGMGWRPGLLCSVYPDTPSGILDFRATDQMNVMEDGVRFTLAADFRDVIELAGYRLTNAWAIRPGHFYEYSTLYYTNSTSNAMRTNTLAAAVSFSAMFSSPMFTGFNSPDDPYWMTNAEVLAVQTDPGCLPPTLAYSNNLREIWVKPLTGRTGQVANAVLLVNGLSVDQTFGVSASLLQMQTNSHLVFRDLWAHANIGTNFGTGMDVTVGPTNVVMLSVSTWNYQTNDYLVVNPTAVQTRIGGLDTDPAGYAAVYFGSSSGNDSAILSDPTMANVYFNANTRLHLRTGNSDWLSGDGNSVTMTSALLTQSGAVSLGGTYQQATNALSTWPTSAATGGGFALVNSNATVYILTSTPNSTAWAATNKLAP